MVSYDDIYDFGVNLLEMILGRPSKSKIEVQLLNNQEIDMLIGFGCEYQIAVVATDDATRRSIADPAVQTSCSDQSLKTLMEICVRCLLKDLAERPSIEDVLWNLQYAAQAQEAWRIVTLIRCLDRCLNPLIIKPISTGMADTRRTLSLFGRIEMMKVRKAFNPMVTYEIRSFGT